jgi:hypothetical protein
MPNEKPDWLSVTNMLVAIALAINVIVFAQIKDVGDKVFLHLTNSEIHIPRATVVSKDEFIIYQTMRDKQMDDLKIIANDNKCMLSRIEQKIDSHINKELK